jgi:hypothetical protein
VGKNSQRSARPKLVPVDFRSKQAVPRDMNADLLLGGMMWAKPATPLRRKAVTAEAGRA